MNDSFKGVTTPNKSQLNRTEKSDVKEKVLLSGLFSGGFSHHLSIRDNYLKDNHLDVPSASPQYLNYNPQQQEDDSIRNLQQRIKEIKSSEKFKKSQNDQVQDGQNPNELDIEEDDNNSDNGAKKSGNFWSTVKAVQAAKDSIVKKGNNQQDLLMTTNAHINSKIGRGLNSLLKGRNKGQVGVFQKKKTKQSQGNFDDQKFLDNFESRQIAASHHRKCCFRTKDWCKRKTHHYCPKICHKKHNNYEISQEDDESEITDENDYKDHPLLSSMNKDEKRQRMLELWRRAFQKAKAATIVINRFENLRMKIELFGRQLLVKGKNTPLEEEIDEKPCPCLIMPSSIFKLFWNIVIIILLLYTATWMPYQICFVDQTSTGSLLILEYSIDCLFFLDIVFNFITAYDNPDGTIETRLKYIAWNYCKLWFIIDSFAIVPSQIFEYGTKYEKQVQHSIEESSRNDYNKLVRIARIVRLYRLLRIFRLFKIMKLLRYSVGLSRIMEKIKMNAAASRMILITILGIFFVHLISCFWYFAAKMDDFNPDTWVYRMKMQDKPLPHIYLECSYWAFQTIATVGFGEFGAETYTELIMSVIWMISGVSFYSVVIGNLTSMIANETANSENLFNKLKALEEFSEKTSLPEDLNVKIRQFLENNYDELFSRIDEKQLVNELPITLRDEVLQHQYQGLLSQLEMLRNCDNTEFVWSLVQQLRKIKVDKNEVIYSVGEFSEEIYFIKQGKVKLYAPNGYPYFSCKDGEQFGDYEVILNHPREGKAVAFSDSLFYTLTKDDLDNLLEQYEDMRFFIESQAEKSRDKHRKLRNEAMKINPIFNKIKNQLDNQFLKTGTISKFGLGSSKRDLYKQDQLPDSFRTIDNTKGEEKNEMPEIKILGEVLPQRTLSADKLPLPSNDSLISPNIEQYQGLSESESTKEKMGIRLVQNQGNEEDKNGRDKLEVPKVTNPLLNMSHNSQNNSIDMFKENENSKKPQMATHPLTGHQVLLSDLMNDKQEQKIKERMEKVLSSMDDDPSFTKNVMDLLQQSPRHDVSTHDIMRHQEGGQDTVLIQECNFNQKLVDELKSKYAQKNKVSTLESYERKAKESSSHQPVSLLTFHEKQKSSSKVGRQKTLRLRGQLNIASPNSPLLPPEDDLQKELSLAAAAYADAEQGMEILALFNEDMSTISMNVYQIQGLFELISKENEEIIGWMGQLERQTIGIEERHFKNERKIDALLKNIQ